MTRKAQISTSLSLLLFCLSFAGFAQQPSPAASPSAVIASQHVSAQDLWADLMAGNHRFITGTSQIRDVAGLRQSLAKGQHPRIIVLACSDSRVAPELLFDKSLGDLFVIRSAGNIADAIGLGSMEYAVEHLGSTMIVVLGHQKCGAVTAACSGDRMPTSNLQTIVDHIAPAVTEARTHAKSDELVEAAVRQNVLQSAHDLLAGSEVLRHAVHDGKLVVVEAVYSLDTGEVSSLGKIQGNE